MPAEATRIDDLRVGMSAQYEQTISDADVKTFAGLSGDNNPVHMSDRFAETSRFKKRIAHGMLSATFFSMLLGTKLPGPGSIYVQQQLQFKRPVYLGDTVVATVTITAIDLDKERVMLATTAEVNGKIVIDGSAEIYLPRPDGAAS